MCDQRNASPGLATQHMLIWAIAAAHASRLVDERGIDGLIAALVRGTCELGGRARKLQSGLVHRELLIAVAGVALIFALLMIGP